jgi:hypothetical protein
MTVALRPKRSGAIVTSEFPCEIPKTTVFAKTFVQMNIICFYCSKLYLQNTVEAFDRTIRERPFEAGMT